MYFNSETAHVAKLAALDHYLSATNILLDSTAQLIDLYTSAGSKALELARHNGSLPDPTIFNQLVPEIFTGHLRVASNAHEDLVRFVEVQIHSTSNLTKFALDKTAQWSPPLLELAVDTTESLIEAGETAADELGDASLKAVIKVEEKLERSTPARKKVRAA